MEGRSGLKTTVVIPNYNGKKYLNNCLKSLEAQGREGFRVLVVDNGSADGSADEALKRFAWIEMIRFPRNEGFCAAVNEGIRRSSTPYVLLLNNDTVMEAGSIAALEKRMDQDARLFSVSARMVDMADPSVMDGAGDLYSALGWAYAVGKGHPASGYEKPQRIFSSCAGAAIYRKAYLEKTGLLDEMHFAYLEDVDLGYRARICGFENAYEPGAVVRHAGSATSGSRYNPFKVTQSAKNNVYLVYKNMPLLQLILNLPLLAVGFAAKAVFFLKKGYGSVYLKGIGAGIRLCVTPAARARKVRFKWRNLGNYIRIQAELWVNCFRRV